MRALSANIKLLRVPDSCRGRESHWLPMFGGRWIPSPTVAILCLFSVVVPGKMSKFFKTSHGRSFRNLIRLMSERMCNFTSSELAQSV